MKKVSVLILLFFGLVGFSAAQTVTIGNQVWTTKNLNVDKFRNGDPIPEAKTEEEWIKAGKNKQPAWCYYDNDPENGEKFGKLYNWYALNDPRGLAPVGYHVPSDSEWKQLIKNLAENIEFLDTAEERIRQLIDKANEIGFSQLPSGARSNDGPFGLLGSSGYWWSSTESSTDSEWGAWFQQLDYFKVEALEGGKDNGLSIRCLKD
jgi:uncharacterized protein (TIGR02145 family)